MRQIIILFFILFLTSCRKYITDNRDVTLSGKYKLALLDVTNVDQNISRDSTYRPGSVYINRVLPKPFDSIVINRFYIHLTYSEVRLNLIGVSQTGRDRWQYGESPNEIFYNIWGNNSFFNGFLQFTYYPDSSARTLTFLIEDDGFESLQLQSSGAWFRGKFGEKQVMTMVLTRVGP